MGIVAQQIKIVAQGWGICCTTMLLLLYKDEEVVAQQKKIVAQEKVSGQKIRNKKKPLVARTTRGFR